LLPQLLAASSAGDSAVQRAERLAADLDAVRAALNASEADRHALAAQRDGWMASYQEAHGKLQEWAASGSAAATRLAQRAAALQGAAATLGTAANAMGTARDACAASSRQVDGRDSSSGISQGIPNTTDSNGDVGNADEWPEGEATTTTTAAGAAAVAEAAASASLAAAAAQVLDHAAGLQALMQAEAAEHALRYGEALTVRA
jgi:hypothetical protein